MLHDRASERLAVLLLMPHTLNLLQGQLVTQGVGSGDSLLRSALVLTHMDDEGMDRSGKKG
jgi:hypothetical protein